MDNSALESELDFSALESELDNCCIGMRVVFFSAKESELDRFCIGISWESLLLLDLSWPFSALGPEVDHQFHTGINHS